MTTAKAAAKMVAQSNTGGSKGPGNKNLQSSRRSKPNPSSMISSMAGRVIKGPDGGGG